MLQSTPMRRATRRDWDEDGRQEFQLALLEGCTKDEAKRRAASAHNNNSYKRQLGPRWGATGKPILVYPEFFEGTNPVPLTMDRRAPEEVLADFDKREQIERLLALVTARQRAVLEVRYGLTSGEPATLRDTADLLGYASFTAAEMHEKRALERIRRELHRAENSDEIAEEKRRRKNEYNRKFMARKRAEGKGMAA